MAPNFYPGATHSVSPAQTNIFTAFCLCELSNSALPKDIKFLISLNSSFYRFVSSLAPHPHSARSTRIPAWVQQASIILNLNNVRISDNWLLLVFLWPLFSRDLIIIWTPIYKVIRCWNSLSLSFFPWLVRAQLLILIRCRICRNTLLNGLHLQP